MKKIAIFDIAFIAITAGLLSIIHYLGFQELLSTYAFIVAMTAYFIGKYFGKTGSIRNQNK
jgi:CDP-diglyceride synthetase